MGLNNTMTNFEIANIMLQYTLWRGKIQKDGMEFGLRAFSDLSAVADQLSAFTIHSCLQSDAPSSRTDRRIFKFLTFPHSYILL